MSKTDILDLDGRLLRCFLAILEETSVSRAAERLGVTQSAVSHALARLRRIIGDPLFVRSGPGLVPTETALALKDPVIAVLDGMQALTHRRAFDPTGEAMAFTIAANDMQRDLIFPALLRRARAAGITPTMAFRPSGVPSLSLLRDARCDLIVTPLPPDAPDMIQQKLFTGRLMCFYDASETAPPATLAAWLAADHVTVRFALGGHSTDVIVAPEVPRLPEPRLSVSNFAGIPPFIRHTAMITTQLDFMHQTALSGLDMAPLPFATAPVSVFMVWHERSTRDPAHSWLRAAVVAEARRVAGAEAGRPAADRH